METMWQRCEIENYIYTRESLLALAVADVQEDLFGHAEKTRRREAMEGAIGEIEQSLANLNQPSPWSADIKGSDGFLDILFAKFSQKLGVPLVLRKADYYLLVGFLPSQAILTEVRDKLDAIVAVAKRAKPVE